MSDEKKDITKQPCDVSHIPIAANGYEVPLSAEQFIAAIYERNDCVVWGDTGLAHRNNAVRQTFAEAKGTSLRFLEISRDHQPIVDEYMKTGNVELLSPFGDIGEDVRFRQLTGDWISIFTMARESGTEIYCMDVTQAKSKETQGIRDSQDREAYIEKHGLEKWEADHHNFITMRDRHNEDMVSFIAEIVEKKRKENPEKPVKFDALIGSAHNKNLLGVDKPDFDEIVASRLRCNTVHVEINSEPNHILNPYVTVKNQNFGADTPEFVIHAPAHDTLQIRNACLQYADESYKFADSCLADLGTTSPPRQKRESIALDYALVKHDITEMAQNIRFYTETKSHTPAQKKEYEAIPKENFPDMARLKILTEVESGLKDTEKLLNRDAMPDFSAIEKSLRVSATKIDELQWGWRALETSIEACEPLRGLQVEVDKAQYAARRNKSIQVAVDYIRPQLSTTVIELAKARKESEYVKEEVASIELHDKTVETLKKAISEKKIILPQGDKPDDKEAVSNLCRMARLQLYSEAIDAGDVASGSRKLENINKDNRRRVEALLEVINPSAPQPAGGMGLRAPSLSKQNQQIGIQH